MNMFQFTCPLCGYCMKLPETAIGRQGKCPNCAKVVMVAVNEQPDEGSSGQRTDSPAADPTLSEEGTVNTTCPTCSRNYHVSSEKVGKTVICRDCSSTFIVRSGAGRHPTAWSEEGHLVLKIAAKEHHFDTCPISNQQATTLETIRFSYSSISESCLAVCLLLLLLGPFGLIIMLWNGKRAKVQIPLSEDVRTRRKKFMKIYRILVTSVLCGFLLPIVALSMSDALLEKVVWISSPLISCIFPALYFERKARLFACQSISDGYIYLSGASAEFLDTLPPFGSTSR
jgi:hypothetical protein